MKKELDCVDDFLRVRIRESIFTGSSPRRSKLPAEATPTATEVTSRMLPSAATDCYGRKIVRHLLN